MASSSKVLWQKAKIIKAELPGWVGREIWTRGRPELALVNLERIDRSIVVNLIPLLGFFDCGIQPDQIELLPEFAEDVPMFTIEEFLALPKSVLPQ